MRNFLIDIGNSNIKTAIGSGKKLIRIKRFSYTSENFPSIFKKVLEYKLEEFDYIGISTLNKNTRIISSRIIKKKYSVNPFYINYKNKLLLRINYEKSLGNDRICSAVAAFEKYPWRKNILIIDFGTATTYNLISNKIFKGGLITPGIHTSLQSLNEKANLPVANLKKSIELVSNKTKSNILSGVIHQSLYTTETIIINLKKKYKNLFIIATGGFAELIFKRTRLINKIEKNLVLEGINDILKFNLK